MSCHVISRDVSKSVHNETVLEWVVPERVLGYQSLIIDAHREFKGDYWMGYDRCFQQSATATRIDKWVNVNIRYSSFPT